MFFLIMFAIFAFWESILNQFYPETWNIISFIQTFKISQQCFVFFSLQALHMFKFHEYFISYIIIYNLKSIVYVFIVGNIARFIV